MKLKDIKRIIVKKYIALKNKEKISVLRDYCMLGIILEGEKGIAKTAFVRSIANLFDCSREMDASHSIDKFDYEGIPLEGGLKYGFLNGLKGTKLLFIDELNKAQKSSLSILNSIMTNDDHISVGEEKIDISNRIVICAQNPSNDEYEFSSSIEDKSFLSRFIKYSIEPDWDSFRNYCKGKKENNLKLDDIQQIEINYPNNWDEICDFVIDRMMAFSDFRRISYLLGSILLYLNGIEKDTNFLYSELAPIFKKDGFLNREDYTPILQEIIAFLKEIENIDFNLIKERKYEKLNNETVNILIMKSKDLKNEEVEEIIQILKEDKNKIIKIIPENLYKNLLNALVREDSIKNSKKKIKEKIENAINNIKI